MHSAHPKIKFEIGKTQSSQVMDFLGPTRFQGTIKASDDTEFDFHRKSAIKPTFVHYKSAIPVNTKHNIIKSEINRIKLRCSTQESRERNHKNFFNILSLNGFPPNFANNLHRSRRNTMALPKAPSCFRFHRSQNCQCLPKREVTHEGTSFKTGP